MVNKKKKKKKKKKKDGLFLSLHVTPTRHMTSICVGLDHTSCRKQMHML